MTATYDAVVAGHICLDVIPDLTNIAKDRFTQALGPGRLTEIGPVTFGTGGPVSNTGLALIKLGIETRLMGKVGDDTFGQSTPPSDTFIRVSASNSHTCGVRTDNTVSCWGYQSR